jgi:hypothetical protein
MEEIRISDLGHFYCELIWCTKITEIHFRHEIVVLINLLKSSGYFT